MPSFAEGQDKGSLRGCIDLAQKGYFKRAIPQSGTTPYELFALLLFTPPSVLTLRTLLALFQFGERSHQFRAEPLQPLPYVVLLLGQPQHGQDGRLQRGDHVMYTGELGPLPI